MRDGWFLGKRVSHPMVTNHGLPKGIRTILLEGGLFVPGMKLDEARKLLASQPDFAEQKALLQETVESLGHAIIFYPKFHPEFNYIEMYWGACKAFTRRHCDYSWKTLKTTVPRALNSVR